jgi:hypothetical protein
MYKTASISRAKFLDALLQVANQYAKSKELEHVSPNDDNVDSQIVFIERIDNTIK